MTNPLKTLLELYVGTDLTDPEALSKIFHRSTIPDYTYMHCRSVYAPTAVYNLYWETYDHAMRLAESIDAVMADGEHALIIEEAQNLGYRLPDIQAFKQEAAVYKQALEDLERQTIKRSGQDYVEVPIKTARELNDLMKKNCYMIARIFDECFNTEYLKHFAFYRKRGVRYAGPNALQPCVDLLVSMTRAVKGIDTPEKDKEPKPNWEALIAGNREDFLKPKL